MNVYSFDMTPRRYEQQRRAERAAETRQRIVTATMGVHMERGISKTTLRDIATAADVSPGTVLRHFPDMADLVDACGALSMATFPFPAADVLDGTADGRPRLRAAVRAIFGYWGAIPQAWPMMAGERMHWPSVERFDAELHERRRALLDAALPRGRGRRRLLAAALAATTWTSLESLHAEGLDLDGATDVVVDVLTTAGTAPAR